MLWMIEPTGISLSASAFPGARSASGPDDSRVPTRTLTGARMYRRSPSSYCKSAMRALRFGSYSIAMTRAGMPILLRFQSMMRYIRLCPPPRWRVVMRPLLLRPAVFFSGSVSAFSGLVLVISSKVDTDMPRRPGEVGLYVLTGIWLRLPRTGQDVDPRLA